MSLMSMRRTMASKKTANIILWGLIVVFVAGIALMSIPGGGLGSQKFESNLPGSRNVVATVNGKPIYAGELNDEFMKDGRQYDLNTAIDGRKQIAENAILKAVQAQVVKEKHVYTWSWTLQRMAREMAEVQLAAMHQQAREQAKNPQPTQPGEKAPANKTEAQIFADMLTKTLQGAGYQGQKPGEKDFISFFSKMMMSKDTETRGQYDLFLPFAQTRLVGVKVAKDFKVSPFTEPFVKTLNTKEVKASWVFVAAKEKTKKGLADARKKANDLRNQVVANPGSFSEVAKTQSDDFVSRFQGGSLDWINADTQNASPMAVYLAFSNKKNEISPVVSVVNSSMSMYGMEPQTGYAFVKVDDIRDRVDLKGFNWNRDKRVVMLRAQMQFQYAFGESYIAIKRAEATVVRRANEMKYFEAMEKGDAKTIDQLTAKLMNDTSLPEVVQKAFQYRVAQTTKDPQQLIALLGPVIPFASATDAPKIQIDLGRAYAAAGAKDDAKEQFKNAADGLANGDADQSLHQALKVEFKKLGDTENVKAMDEWIKKHPKNANGGGGLNSMPISINPQ